ncbi:hypothetical protein K438DRAFT_1766433 [Mycena galopus ATCC 62051]|nr:hypothetical protein K438DRAFT_1766433 [Mycena galopus ATCC 62051]
MIEEIQAGRRFTVKSQSIPGQCYTVDLEAYTCGCPSFPEISFCKHICAVEDHFPDLVVPRSLPVASQPWDEDIIASVEQSLAPTAPTRGSSQPVPAVNQEDAMLLLLHYIVNKLQFIQRSKATLSQPLTTSLRALDDALADTTNGAEVLPPTVKNIASNQGTRNETEQVMGSRRKGGKKRKITDGYAGGQSSGKLAHPDARTAKKPRTAAPAPSGPSETRASLDDIPSSFQADNLDGDLDGDFEGLTDGLLPVDHDTTPPIPPPSVVSLQEAIESPMQVLLKSIAIHNTMYPLHIPQTTSYYRDNGPLPVSVGSYYRTR